MSRGTAWRELSDGRRLRRPSGGTEEAEELADELAVAARFAVEAGLAVGE